MQHEHREEIPPDYIAPSLRDIAEICGIDTARNLVYYWPSCRIYIPKKLTSGSQLYLLGERPAKKLCAMAGGADIEIPRSLYSDEGQAALAAELRDQNMRQQEIAQALGVSMRQVRRILSGSSAPRRGKAARPPPGQMDIEDYLRNR